MENMKWKIFFLSAEQGMEDSTVVFLDEMASNVTEPKRPVYEWNIFFGWISL